MTIEDEIEQHRARGYSKEETAKKVGVPLGWVENVWAHQDAALTFVDRTDDSRHGKRGAA